MSIPLRNFFIAFDRNREHKKELLFNVNFFYLKSFKKKGFTFSYINEPFFQGSATFGLDFKNKVRTLTFSKIEKDGNLQPVDPRLMEKFILSEKNKFIVFSDQTPLEETEPIRKMLESFQYNKEKIITLTLCNLCMEKHKFTLLNENIQIKSYNDQILCSECAYNVVIKRIKLTGLISRDKISPKLKNFLMHLLLKFKDVKKVLEAFKAD
ncbi:MAG: hypothetical protein ACFFAT_21215, partial [Promethearchaeota archaeon]